MNEARNRAIFDREFADWLPPQVFDAHIHLVHRDSYPPGFEPPRRSCQSALPNGSYTWEACAADVVRLTPNRGTGGLCFGMPDPQVDREHANRYVASVCDGQAWFGLALVAPEDSVKTVRRWVTEYGLLGYKPYHALVTSKLPAEVTIPDMLPAAQMELADELGLIIMLHLPRPERLADPRNQREVAGLADRYPRTSIILAHIGRAYYVKCVVGQLDAIRERPNVYVDLAMLNHWEVVAYLFEQFPRDRIVFGTDLPISRFGGKSVEVNDQYAYLMEQDISIGSSIYDADHVLDFTSFYYEELRAIKKAAEHAGLSRKELGGIFWANAERLVGRGPGA
jgi:hypothetical protein